MLQRSKAPDTFKFLRRAIFPARPKCSHRCVSRKETPLKRVEILQHTTQNSTEQTVMRTKWFINISRFKLFSRISYTTKQNIVNDYAIVLYSSHQIYCAMTPSLKGEMPVFRTPKTPETENPGSTLRGGNRQFSRNLAKIRGCPSNPKGNAVRSPFSMQNLLRMSLLSHRSSMTFHHFSWSSCTRESELSKIREFLRIPDFQFQGLWFPGFFGS